MNVLDSNYVLALLDPKAAIPPDPSTGKKIDKGRERVEHLIETLSDAGSRIIIPTPVLAEVLVHAGQATADYVAKLRSVAKIHVADFDARAAIECAQLTGAALARGNRRGAAASQPWQKVKIDRQIVAIALVEGATIVYTCDAGLATLARASGLTAKHIADLPLPPVKSQQEMFDPK